MLERIIIGVVIGLAAGFFLSGKFKNEHRNIVIGFMLLIIVAFVGSSFMFGAVYGAMAVGEIALGYWLSSTMLGQAKA